MYPQGPLFQYKAYIDRCVLTVGALSGTTAKLQPSIGAVSPVVNLHGWQSRPVDISQRRQ